jgi:signal transduction histidine kinase
MFRLRIAALFGVFSLVAAAASALAIYGAAARVQSDFEGTVITPLSVSQEPAVRRAIGVYRAFRERNAIRATREAAFSFAAILAAGSAISLTAFFALSRPLSRLRKRITEVDWAREDSLRPQPEEGSEEVRSLARAWNAALSRLSEYRAIVGDASRFRGWKEIARVTVHEVNNLLSPVWMYAELLAEKLTGEEAEHANEIVRKLVELRGVLTRLRSMSHLPEARPERGDICELARSVAAEFPEGRAATVLPDQPVFGDFDAVLLGEALRNLVKNALECGPQVTARVGVEPCGGKILLTVRDDGPGIPDDLRERIFEAGYSSKEGNLGIGLAVSRHVAREHGAFLALESVPGEGSCFSLELPFAKGDAR